MLMRSIDSIACQELPVTVKKEPSVNLEEKHAESYEGHLEWQANLTDAQWEEFFFRQRGSTGMSTRS